VKKKIATAGTEKRERATCGGREKGSNHRGTEDAEKKIGWLQRKITGCGGGRR